MKHSGTKLHRAWLVLVGMCMIQLSTGLVINCRGVFLTPVAEGLNMGFAAVSGAYLVGSLTSVLTAVFLVAEAFRRIDSRKLIGAAALLQAAEMILFASARSPVQFYIAGILDGFSGQFLRTYPLQVILRNWFRKKRGFAVGIAIAFAGIFGTVGNVVLNEIITAFGWRAGYLAVGIIFLAGMFPAAFFLHMSPEDVGLAPYGEDETAPAPEDRDGPDGRQAIRSPGPWLLFLACFMITFLYGFSGYISSLAVFRELGSRIGALATSLCMVGNTVSKVVIGGLYDRFGRRGAALFCFPCVLAGTLLMQTGNGGFLCAGALLFGISSGISTVLLPLILSDLFGARAYPSLIAYMSAVMTIGVSAGGLAIGRIIDRLGPGTGYTLSMDLCLALTLLTLLAIRLSVRLRDRRAARSV